MLEWAIGQQEVTTALTESRWLYGKDNSPVSEAVHEKLQCRIQTLSSQEWLNLISFLWMSGERNTVEWLEMVPGIY